MERLGDLHARIRAHVWNLLRQTAPGAMAGVAEKSEAKVTADGDTIFVLDAHADDIVDDFFSAWGQEIPLLLIAEGISGDGGRTYPAGTPRDQVTFTCVVDPIDGTRGLMYQKRSAWILSGIAPSPASGLPCLNDIYLAMQTEIPTPRSHLSDMLWAVQGHGTQAETRDMESGAVRPFQPQPSRATSLLHGFATVSRFFPGAGNATSRFEQELMDDLLPPAEGQPQVFEDQYISSGGQLYELMVGHDRFVADLRPLLLPLSGYDLRSGYAHPYDVCTELIAREAGVVVTDERGGPLRTSLDIRGRCSWIGYANRSLRTHIEPALLDGIDRLSRFKSVQSGPESGLQST